jgi:hypothetical protein
MPARVYASWWRNYSLQKCCENHDPTQQGHSLNSLSTIISPDNSDVAMGGRQC